MSPDFLIALTILSNFVLVATSRVNKAIQIAAVQGVLLGLIPLAMGLGRHSHILLMVAAAILVKGWFIPFMLRRALHQVHINREVDPYIGYTVSLMLCALGTGLSLVLGHMLPLKVGTKVRNIRLVNGVGDHDIDCKIDGFGPMQLKSSVVRKA